MRNLCGSAATFQRGTTLKLCFIALVYLDLALTLVGARAGFAELNPVMGWMLANPLQLVLIKIVTPLILSWLVPGQLLVPSMVFAAAVSLWNVLVLFAGL